MPDNIADAVPCECSPRKQYDPVSLVALPQPAGFALKASLQGGKKNPARKKEKST
jgi:hypothetical protein